MIRLRLASFLAVLPAAAALLGACHPAPPTELVAGDYRAALTLPGGELPFGIKIVMPAGKPPVVYVLNGAEAVHVTEATHDGAKLVLPMPGYANRLELSADATGYHGEAVLFTARDQVVRLPLKVVRDARYRFVQGDGPKIPPKIGGRWAITFKDPGGHERAAVGEFKQLGTRLFGTILDRGGDHRYLEGDVTQSEVLLSSFDGGRASLYRARINADGTLAGHWWSGTSGGEDFTARPDAEATLPAEPPAPRPAGPVAFAFPDLDGKTVSFDDARFRGKVVVLAVGGSWCPNSHDEAAFLASLYKELKPEGLEIVSLQFEPFADRAAATAANRRFVAQFGIEWPVLLAGPADLGAASAALPALGTLRAFPTTALVGRDGVVRSVETGFDGPATGMHHEEYRKRFGETVRTLLAEKH